MSKKLKKDTFMRQCKLSQGSSHTVVWIPEKYCGVKIEVGMLVLLEDLNNQYWTVETIGEKAMTKADLDRKDREVRKGLGSIQPL